MKTLLFVFLLVARAYGCVDVQCECPNITTISNLRDATYEDGPGCTFNITCTATYSTMGLSSFNTSNVPPPADKINDLLVIELWDESKPSPTVNFIELLGIECENGLWYATKFPFGISYMLETRLVQIPANEVDGKGYKAVLNRIAC